MGDGMRAEMAIGDALGEAMSDVSEDCWAASWLCDCEHDLWEMMAGQSPLDWGMGRVLECDVDRMRMLAAEGCCWAAWSDRDHAPCPVPLLDWLALHGLHQLLCMLWVARHP